jgi:hypothetical protein
MHTKYVSCAECGTQVESYVTKAGAVVERFVRLPSGVLCFDCAWKKPCEVCGDAAGIIIPGHAVCGAQCYSGWQAAAQSKREEPHLNRQDANAEKRLAERMRELHNHVHSQSDGPYVTTGPYSLWPQPNLSETAKVAVGEMLDRVLAGIFAITPRRAA